MKCIFLTMCLKGNPISPLRFIDSNWNCFLLQQLPSFNGIRQTRAQSNELLELTEISKWANQQLLTSEQITEDGRKEMKRLAPEGVSPPLFLSPCGGCGNEDREILWSPFNSWANPMRPHRLLKALTFVWCTPNTPVWNRARKSIPSSETGKG